jgi:hypothetical protein
MHLFFWGGGLLVEPARAVGNGGLGTPRPHQVRRNPATAAPRPAYEQDVHFAEALRRLSELAGGYAPPKLPDHIAQSSPLGRAWRTSEHALDDRIADAQVKA